MNKIKILLLSILLNFLVFSSFSFSEIIKKIEISGNKRISSETILMFSQVNLADSVDGSKINQILKNLYNSNFFNDVSVKVENNMLYINVDEAPLIKDMNISGVKAEKFKKIDFKRYPMIKLLNLLPPKQSLFETIIVSANDTLVELFLNKKIKFTDIQKKLFYIVNKKEFLKYKNIHPKKITDIVKLNNYVRLKTLENNI